MLTMNTKVIMTVTAILLAALGVGLTFAPEEILTSLGIVPNAVLKLVLQLLGGAYYGLALLNWMSKGNIIGGIYSRPLVLGNMIHFIMGGIALCETVLTNPQLPYALSVLAVIYPVMAALFALMLRRHPVNPAQ